MDILDLATSVDVGWTLVAAALVFFMQAGFAMVETGFTRAKNAGNIIMKNLMDFSLGTPIFWVLGFGIMFGAASPFFGGFDFFADGVVGEGYDWTTLIFQTVFCATAATIVSGSMAERTKFSAYCIYSMIILRSFTRFPVTGSGAAAGSQSLASMISQAPRRYIWSAALPLWSARLSSVPVSASTPRMARLARSRVTP